MATFETILMLLTTMAAGAAHAGGAMDCKAGQEYDALTMKCVAESKPKPTANVVASDPAVAMLREWRTAVETNTKHFSDMDKEGCTFRGAAHKEPDIGQLKAIGVIYADGESATVIPHEVNCRKENDKFALSRTECRLGYYQYKKNLKKFTYEERKITLEPGDAKGVTWSKMSGTEEYPVASFMPRPVDVVTKNVEVQAAFPDADQAACQLARTVDKFGPSWRSAEPATGGGTGKSSAAK